MSRPELSNLPAAEFYGKEGGAESYNRSSRVQEIQRTMTLRALELLQLPKRQPQEGDEAPVDPNAPRDVSCHILDVGCGSGLSGAVLSEVGHTWVGCDIARSMLSLAQEGDRDEDLEDDDDDNESDEDGDEATDRSRQFHVPAGVRVDQYGRPIFGQIDDEDSEEEDDDDDDAEDDGEVRPGFEGVEERRAYRELLEVDMGHGMPFRPGSFDGVISISAVQWLCNSEVKGQVPQKRLRELFQTLYNCLRRGARAVFQFYPENAKQINMITQAAMKCGFGGGMVVDFPHSTRAKKYYLVLTAGSNGAAATPGGSSYVLPHPLLSTPSTPPQLIPYLEHQYVARYACAPANVMGFGCDGEGYGFGNGGEGEEDDWEDVDEEGDDEEDEDEYDSEELEMALKQRMAGYSSSSHGGVPVAPSSGVGATRPIDARKVRVAGRVSGNKHALAAAARKRVRGKDNRPVTGTKAWVLMKKAERRRRGLDTKPDSKKYSLRKRKPRF